MARSAVLIYIFRQNDIVILIIAESCINKKKMILRMDQINGMILLNKNTHGL